MHGEEALPMTLVQVPYDPREIFVDNPDPRCPCVLLLDKSGSMTGTPIAELNGGLRAFEEELKRDPLACRRVEIAIVSFGPVTCDVEFAPTENFVAPTLQAGGDTPMGEAILVGLDLIDKRKQVYRQHGVAYYRPWVFLITDGAPTDEWQEAAERVHLAERDRKLAFFAVGVEGANFDVLSRISVRTPLKLKGLNFRELFVWLSASLAEVSRSRPGDQVALPPPGWSTL
jgi:uncharacterized protein YegL